MTPLLQVSILKKHYPLRSGLFGDAAVTRIVKTARVVARLYALQLEELDHA